MKKHPLVMLTVFAAALAISVAGYLFEQRFGGVALWVVVVAALLLTVMVSESDDGPPTTPGS